MAGQRPLAFPLMFGVALNDYDPLFYRREFRKMPTDLYQQIIDYISQTPYPGVLILTNGEPFVDQRMNDILFLARQNGWLNSVDTWGGWVDSPFPLKNIGQLRLRLLSLKSERHDALMGISGNQEKVVSLAEELRDNFHGEVILVFPIGQPNYEELLDVLAWGKLFGYKVNAFVLPRGHRYALDLNSFQKVLSMLREIQSGEVIIDLPLLGRWGMQNLCPGGWASMFVGTEGDVKPCPYFPYPIAYLEGDVIIAWQMLKQRVAKLNKTCRSCSFFSQCGGGCLVNKDEDGRDFYCPGVED